MRDTLVTRLRAAGCVFAEQEATLLIAAANSDPTYLDQLATARAHGTPLEQLLGWVEFAGLRLSVSAGVFVPRQRTLHLLDRALGELRRIPAERTRTFVEAFAGVAPLAAAVSDNLRDVRVLACDRDQRALRCSSSNLGDRGAVCQSNVLNGIPETYRHGVDVIAAVPPYVPDGDLGLLPREARDYEPLSALCGGVDGLDWIRALIREAAEHIAPGGLLLIELSERQLESAAEYGRSRGWQPEHTVQPDDSLTTVLALRAG
ncbi:MAG: putative protein N(5)-glutamine methyltransferase [Cumulibacter sp.]